MTLVLTLLSPHGIAMAADTAVTEIIRTKSGRPTIRVLTGVRKLHAIPEIQAGISCWGLGRIEDIPTDVWLSNFIRSNENNYDTLEEFALLLRDHLRQLISEIQEPADSYTYRYGSVGFHLAGFVNFEGNNVPTAYHVHNGQSEIHDAMGRFVGFRNINPRIINANYDFPAELVLNMFSLQRFPYLRNGDFHVFAALFNRLEEFFSDLRRNLRILDEPFQIPNTRLFQTPLDALAEYLRFYIGLVRDIYALSNYPPIIGGDIINLTITPERVFGPVTR